jgi:hypothetical protein
MCLIQRVLKTTIRTMAVTDDGVAQLHMKTTIALTMVTMVMMMMMTMMLTMSVGDDDDR